MYFVTALLKYCCCVYEIMLVFTDNCKSSSENNPEW